MIRLLRDKLKISSNQIRFVSGVTNEDKVIEINFDYEISEKEICNKLFEEN
ncbi:MAG: hypothetical protein P8Y97_18835 [Candidatus Lokiarchaeota archaeon]